MSAFCNNCGAAAGGASFCANCGSAIGMATNNFQAPNNSYQQGNSYQAGNPSTSTAMWAHLGGLLAGWLVPLIIRSTDAARRDRYVYEQSTEALNFQLHWMLINFGVLIVGAITCGIGWFLYLATGIIPFVLGIMASVAVSRGENYRYPLMMFRLIK